MNDALRTDAAALHDQLVAWRRELHRQPELGFQERRTSAFVVARLEELGLEIKTGIAETGVAAILRAGKSRGPAVLLRADMDALPIQEVAGRDYGSEVPGKMHACGHDGHMSMLLGAATMLVEQRDALTRDVVFCFQPAEEGGGGGERMIEEGVLDLVPIGSVFALHLWSQFEAGTIHLRPGPIMAAQDEFRATIIGDDGHGAQPHLARDPIVAAAQVVTALQSVVSRNVDPVQPAVVTVGSLHAGSAHNVIPSRAVLEGTLRSFDETTRETLRRRVKEIVEGTALALGCETEFELKPGYPAVVNDPASAARVRRLASSMLGEERVVETPPMAAAEDFSYFLNQRPGAFIFVGAGNKSRGITAPHHSADFDIDESVLVHGAELFTRLALDPGD